MPERAASMLNGRVGVEEPGAGASARRNGDDEERRLVLERRPMRLCLGEPRLWAMGVLFVVFGTVRDRLLGFGLAAPVLALPMPSKGEYFGVAVCLGAASMRLNFDDFTGVPSTALPFFDGEKRMFGSMFSVSRSESNGSGERRRLSGALSWPLDGDVTFA